MNLITLLFGYRGSSSMYAIPMVIGGIALTLSMPAASRLTELIAQPWHPFPFAFFLSYTVISAMMALRIGASTTPDDIHPRYATAVLRILARVSFGHFLMLPLIAYSRMLFPDSVLSIVGATALIYLVCLMMSLVAMLLHVRDEYYDRSSLGRRYAFFILYFSLPLLGLISDATLIRMIALISPVQSLVTLLAPSASVLERTIALSIPGLIVVVLSVILFRKPQGRPDVVF